MRNWVSKGTIKKVKRQHTQCDTVFTVHIYSKKHVPKIHLTLKSSKKRNNSIKNGQRICINSSPKKDIQMENDHMEKCSISLASKKMQIKTTIRHIFTPMGMAVIQTDHNKY